MHAFDGIWPSALLKMGIGRNWRVRAAEAAFAERASRIVARPSPHAAKLVGPRGFEPPTYWSQTSRATKLRYGPTLRT